MIDIGMYYVGKVSNLDKKFFTVADGDEVHVYEYPLGEPKKDIRIAIHLAFIEPWDDQEEPKKVAGRFPNYRIEEVN
jgi:hypothetical protein